MLRYRAIVRIDEPPAIHAMAWMYNAMRGTSIPIVMCGLPGSVLVGVGALTAIDHVRNVPITTIPGAVNMLVASIVLFGVLLVATRGCMLAAAKLNYVELVPALLVLAWWKEVLKHNINANEHAAMRHLIESPSLVGHVTEAIQRMKAEGKKRADILTEAGRLLEPRAIVYTSV